jgi:AcrR family transcriptional regulator
VRTEPASRTPSLEVETALLEGAERLLESQGVGALTVRQMAAEAGVAPMGVYNRFGGKAGVLDALTARGFDQLAATLDAIEETEPLEALAEAARRYRRFAKARPSLYGLMFDRAIPGWQPSPKAVSRAAESFGRLVGYVTRAMAARAIAPGDATEIAQRLWSASHGVVSLELRGLGFVADVDTHHELLVQSLLAGFAGSLGLHAPGAGDTPKRVPAHPAKETESPKEGRR